MVRCNRFVIEPNIFKTEINNQDGYYEHRVDYDLVIYDRVNKRKVVEVNTGNEKLDDELAEQILTMLNIKFIGE